MRRTRRGSRRLRCFFFLKEGATREIYTFPQHEALQVIPSQSQRPPRPERTPERDGRPEERPEPDPAEVDLRQQAGQQDRKSTRLNSSHANISYAVFCLKKKLLLAAHI